MNPRSFGEPFSYQDQITKLKMRSHMFRQNEQNAAIEKENRMMLKKLVNITIGRTHRNIDTGLPKEHSK